MKWYPYRFKTEEEMVKDFGEHWRSGLQFLNAGWGTPGMDYLLGTVLEYDFNGLAIRIPNTGEFPTHNTWSIVSAMLTKNEPPKPNYKPRKLNY